MKNSMSRIAFLGVAALVANAAYAASPAIEAAKDQCIVGEQADGYLGVVDGADADTGLRREVRDNNQQRKAYYAELAAKNGVSIEVTGKLAAEQLINQADSGECYRDQSGEWIQK